MNAKRWAELRHIYEVTLEQPAEQRELYLQAIAGGDLELCSETLAMLRQPEGSGLLDLSLVNPKWLEPVIAARALAPGGTLAGRYKILRPIGGGGMGEVYEVQDLDLGARVALKTMRLSDDDALARFKREIYLARTVTHPNVCRIFDLHRHHNSETGEVLTFLTMELVAGQTLSKYLESHGALTAAEALPIAEQIAQALSAAHRKEVIHRDLKASNVMITEDGKVVVMDFGLAAPFTPGTDATVTVVGTPEYMAPEQFEGKHLTAATDVYAFGVLLYEMVVGRPPFEGESPLALALAKVQHKAPRADDVVPSLPTAWAAVISKCLERDPEKRFQHVANALEQLHRGVGQRPLVSLSRARKHALGAAFVFASLVWFGIWRYAESVHTPSAEALRFYRLGNHALQLGLPWKATSFYQFALEQDNSFTAGRAALAEAWMDLEQPQRARSALAAANLKRPRWQRVAPFESLLVEAADARLRGNPQEGVRLHKKAAGRAPVAERGDVLFQEGLARHRTGDSAGALVLYKTLENSSSARCTAILAQSAILRAVDFNAMRRQFQHAASCFEAAGDLDGLAQTWYQDGLDVSHLDGLDLGLSIAQSSGNIEQQILISAAIAENKIETGEEEAAYILFSRALQIADQHDLSFLAARLLNERAEYWFAKGEFVKSDSYNSPALTVGRSAAMPWTIARCSIRSAKSFLRMELPAKTLERIEAAQDSLKQYPNEDLSAELARLSELAKKSPARPEN